MKVSKNIISLLAAITMASAPLSAIGMNINPVVASAKSTKAKATKLNANQRQRLSALLQELPSVQNRIKFYYALVAKQQRTTHSSYIRHIDSSELSELNSLSNTYAQMGNLIQQMLHNNRYSQSDVEKAGELGKKAHLLLLLLAQQFKATHLGVTPNANPQSSKSGSQKSANGSKSGGASGGSKSGSKQQQGSSSNAQKKSSQQQQSKQKQSQSKQQQQGGQQQQKQQQQQQGGQQQQQQSGGNATPSGKHSNHKHDGGILAQTGEHPDTVIAIVGSAVAALAAGGIYFDKKHARN